jgi:hexosaminidase
MIPFPHRFAGTAGRFELPATPRIAGPTELVELVRQEVPSLVWSQVDNRPDVVLELDPGLVAEGYRLRVEPTTVTIQAGADAGAFYAIQTMKQLLPADACRRARIPGQVWSMPTGLIEDAPTFSWRGCMLDVARHFLPKTFVLKLIDLLAFHKLNVLQLHLTDDEGWRFQSDRYPRLTEVGGWRQETKMYRVESGDGTPHGGFYTKADLAEIVAYAARRFVTVVPEIEMPAHSLAAINAYPILSTDPDAQGNDSTPPGQATVNVEDTTFEFVFGVLEEVLEVFPSEFVHIGGDEVPPEPWLGDPRAQAKMRELGLTEPVQLQAWFMGNVDRWLADRGRRMVCWHDIDPTDLTPGAVVMSWRDNAGGSAAARAGRDTVMAPHTSTYLDYYQSDSPDEPVAMGGPNTVEVILGHEPVPAELSTEEAARVLGTQCELWTEYMPTPERVEYMAFPRICAFAETAWRSDRNRSYPEFLERLRPHLDRLDALGVGYRPLDGPHPWQAGGTGRLKRLD